MHPSEVPLLLAGTFDKGKHIDKMRAKGKSDKEIEVGDLPGACFAAACFFDGGVTIDVRRRGLGLTACAGMPLYIDYPPTL